ncbi:MAG: hypothetical protein IJ074_10590 [Clostridia bacterium]|nr:hypothetical protein [Clostridia bacterium]
MNPSTHPYEAFANRKASVHRIMLPVCAVAAAILLVVTVLDLAGLKLLYAEFRAVGAVLLTMLLLGWGAYALCRKVKNKGGRTLLTLMLVLVILVLGLFSISYIAQYGQLVLPQYRRTVEGPNGRNAVVLRGLEIATDDEAQFQEIERRMSERRSAQGLTEDDPYPVEAYGYTYWVYPKVAGIFYKAKADSQGQIYLGSETQAKLEYDWSGENSLKVTITDPEPGDEGEILLKF